MNWEFNGNYHDYTQVEQFYPLFSKLHDEIKAKGNFPSNYLFKGVLGIEDSKQEDTAIYLLQQSKTEKSRVDKIANLLKGGFIQITEGEGIKKFKMIVQVGTDYSRDSIKEYEESRIVFKDGYITGILPKGHKSRGYHIRPDRLIFAKN